MEYKVKEIPENDFFTLANLHYKMTLCSPFTLNSKMAATDILLSSLKSPSAVSRGLYLGKKLVGFVNGHAISEKVYFWHGLYIEKGHRNQAKKLIDTMEEIILSLGFKAIEANGITEQGINMMENYNYEPKQIVFRKEF